MSQEDLGILTPPSDKAFLIYAAEQNSIPAKDFGEAIIGMEACLREAGRIAVLNFDVIEVLPLERGSVKAIFLYIKKNPWTVIVGLDLVANLLNNSLSLYDRFGVNSFRSPTAEMLQAISDKKILNLCQSNDFKKGAQKIAEPVSEYNPSVKITVGSNSFEITCENKYQFYVGKEEEKIFPELVNGATVQLIGEITRINKTNNDLGFKYKDRILSVVPLEDDARATQFHQYLETDEAVLKGIVVRSNDYVVPKIKVISIEDKKGRQISLFTK